MLKIDEELGPAATLNVAAGCAAGLLRVVPFNCLDDSLVASRRYLYSNEGAQSDEGRLKGRGYQELLLPARTRVAKHYGAELLPRSEEMPRALERDSRSTTVLERVSRRD